MRDSIIVWLVIFLFVVTLGAVLISLTDPCSMVIITQSEINEDHQWLYQPKK